MPEFENIIEAVQVSYKCEKCVNGILKYKEFLARVGHTYLHECDSCGHKKIFDKVYPHLKKIVNTEAK